MLENQENRQSHCHETKVGKSLSATYLGSKGEGLNCRGIDYEAVDR